MSKFNIDRFTAKYITKRDKSLFLSDIESNSVLLQRKIENKKILVIGGAGSIGSSFIKAILPYRPQTLVVVDINENALAELTRELRGTKDMFLPLDYVPYPMDYASPVFTKMFISRQGFDVVANFSAHKHVRSEKDIFSIEVMLRNNVINAKKLMDLLVQYPPEEFFCVSTDKAANPVNIMGASKRIMEDLIFSYSDKFAVKTARFANVAFSNGSLLAGFIARLQKNQPLSAPADVKRYFVSLEESGHICMLACMLGNNREIFFPKLNGEQMMRFDIIAREFLQENGYAVMECDSAEAAKRQIMELSADSKIYPVYFSESDTSGEKMFEEFYTDTECIDMNRFISLGVITGKNKIDSKKIYDFINNLEQMFNSGSTTKKEIINILCSYLSGFEHIETGKNLDEKM
nr:polysaccharide biosynthesis protein [uncultured Acetatifactor sp.]